MSLIRTGSLLPSIISDFFQSTDPFFASELAETRTMWPPANIAEDANEFRIDLALPGMKKNDFDVNIEGDVITISAEKKEEKTEENERYTRREFYQSAFQRSFRIPQTANADKVKASYEDGILKLSIPKKEEAKQGKKREIAVA